MNVATEFDVGPLTWVKSEIDLALERADQALQRYLSSAVVGQGDLTQIKFSRNHLHQVQGALTIVGLDGVVQFAEVLEALLDSIEKQSISADEAKIDLVHRALEGIRVYLDDLIVGQPNQSLRLLPLYTEVQNARGLARFLPSDLFFPDLNVRPPRRDAATPKRSRGELQRLLRLERARFQRGLLAWLRAPQKTDGLNEMLTAVRHIEATQEAASVRTFWWAATGFLTALAEGGLPVDNPIRQLCARIDMQIRRLSEGSRNVAERLLRDTLYFIARAECPHETVQQIKQAFRLPALLPHAELPVMLPEEAVRRRVRDIVSAAEEAWNKYCSGAVQSLPVFREHATALAAAVEQLRHTDYRRLAQAIAAAANWLADDSSRHNDALSMEIATAILLAQNAQENFQRLGSDFAYQVDVTVARVHGCIAGVPPQPGSEVPLLDEMSRRAQEKLLVSQVAREIQSNLAQVEQVLDAFFRDSDKRNDLAALRTPLHQIIGALTIMRQEGAVAALRQCAEEISHFASDEYTPQVADFERVANELSIIGFFVDAMQHGNEDFAAFVSQMQTPAKPEADEAELLAESEEEVQQSVEQQVEQQKREAHALLEALKEQPEDSRLREELKQNLTALKSDADLVADAALGEQAKAMLTALDTDAAVTPQIEQAMATLKPQSAETPQSSAEVVQLSQSSNEIIDAELLGIFLEEAREVLGTISTSLTALQEQPHNSELLTTIRRSFHTLKGSGRMVGLKDVGEAAWAIEQTLNLWLRLEQAPTPELLRLLGQANALFTAWVHHLETRSGSAPDPREMIALAEALRQPVSEAPQAPAGDLTQTVLTRFIEAEAPEDAPEPADDLAQTMVMRFSEAEFAEPAPPESSPSETDHRLTENVLPAALSIDIDVPSDEPEPTDDLAKTQVMRFSGAEFAEPAPPESAPNETDHRLTENALPAALTTDIDALFAEPAPADDMAKTMVMRFGEIDFAEAPPPEAALKEDKARLTEIPSVKESLCEALESPLTETEGHDESSQENELEAFDLSLLEPDFPLHDETLQEIAVTELEEAPEFSQETLQAADDDTELVTPATVSVDDTKAEALPPAVENVSPTDANEVSPGLLEVFSEEAQVHLTTLWRELAAIESSPSLPTPHEMYRAAHTLAGIASTLGFTPVNQLGHALELGLLRRDHSAQPDSLAALGLIRQSIGELDGMLASLLAQRAISVPPGLIEALDDIYPAQVLAKPTQVPVVNEDTTTLTEDAAETAPTIPDTPPSAPPMSAAEPPAPPLLSTIPRMKDEIDEQLLPIFLEESQDLKEGIAAELRAWRADPSNADAVRNLTRLLHTLKGSARMTGAMTLGEITHAIESRVEDARRSGAAPLAMIDDIENAFDDVRQIIERLQQGELPVADEEVPVAPSMAEPAAVPVTPQETPIILVEQRDKAVRPGAEHESEAADSAAARATLRVRADLIDRLVNDAGELSIARARIEGEMHSLKDSLLDLTENVIRLRRQLRDIEIQAELQMQSRNAQTDAQHAGFDPLEFDRFTRFQELTRMMAESVNDVGTVQQNLLKNLDDANAAIVAQARMNREIQQELMGIRMVPFGSLADRLYQVARQTSKELNKRTNLEFSGSQVELDRSVLDKVTAPFEHMLRNAIAHGLESREKRLALGKPEIGEISVNARQEGNEIILSLTDDGRGLDYPAIRARAIQAGLLGENEEISDAHLGEMIFLPGFSTASSVSQVSGRGVGMDVVRGEVARLGGRIETSSEQGRGTTFRLYIPLTLAVTKALLIRVGNRRYAIPSVMIEQVLDLRDTAMQPIQEAACVEWMGNRYPYTFLPHLLGDPAARPEERRKYWVLLLRAGARRLAVQVDELMGNREIVVKNIGAQLARVVGIAGATVLGDGQVVLILNPIALSVRTAPAAAVTVEKALDEPPAKNLPTVMVVDDSLTVRKITGRLLAREGYQVLSAKDGVEALELLSEIHPDVMLVDIEMPRLDGFGLTRNIRADAQLMHIPIIMITSRTAEKHRKYAFEIGVDHYLGKPYQEEELLKLIAGYVSRN